MNSYYLFTLISVTSCYWSLNFHHEWKFFSPGLSPWSCLPHLQPFSTSLMTVNTICGQLPSLYHPHGPCSLLQVWASPVSISQSVSSSLMATPSFQWLSQNLDITLDSSLSNFTSTLSGNSLDSTFKIHPVPDPLSLSWLFPAPSECPSSLA